MSKKPKKPKKPTDKDIYKLWWEYLKRSEAYKEYRKLCEWIKDYEKSGKEFDEVKFVEFNCKYPEIPILKKYQTATNDENWPFFLSLYFTFGKDEKHAFKNWMNWRNELQEFMSEGYSSIHIYDYRGNVENEIDNSIESYKSCYGRKPNLEEFKAHFIKRMNIDNPNLYICVGCGFPIEIDELKRLFGELVRKKREENARFGLGYSELMKNPTRVKYKEVKRYLEVYKLFEEEHMSIEEVVDKIGTKKQKERGGEREVTSKFYRDLDHAREIIKNIPLGYFPRYTKHHSPDKK